MQDASHIKNKKWIPDISVVFDSNFDPFDFALKYCEANEGIKPNNINKAITALKGIANRQIGVIELDHSLDIDEVTEIFIRINSKGTALSQSNFVMSKMAADIEHGGNILRKTVDYFCHLAVKPEFYSHITNDEEFQNSKYASKNYWDEAYYEGYLNGVVLIGACGIDPTAIEYFPFIYLPNAKEPLTSVEVFKKELDRVSTTKSKYHRFAKKIVEEKCDKGMVVHHPPF